MFKGIMGLLAGAVALAQPVAAQTPDHVEPAFDGMQITVPAAT